MSIETSHEIPFKNEPDRSSRAAPVSGQVRMKGISSADELISWPFIPAKELRSILAA